MFACNIHNPISPHSSLSAPNILQQTILLCQPVDGIIALAHRTNKTAKRIYVVLAGNSTSVLVNLGDRNLDRPVVFGLDDAVGGAALAGDVAAVKQVSKSLVI